MAHLVPMLWSFGAGGTVAGPVGLFGTTLHEIGHALAGVVFGLGVDRMVVRSDGSGTTYLSGFGDDTAELAVGSAGYLGMLAFAALFLLVGRWPGAARVTFVVVGSLLVLAALLWMDGAFSFLVPVVLGAACITVAFVVPDHVVTICATVLGAVLAFSGLSDIGSINDANVDALHTEHASGLGLGGVRLVWIVAGLLIVGGALAARFLIHRGPPTPRVERADGGTVE